MKTFANFLLCVSLGCLCLTVIASCDDSDDKTKIEKPVVLSEASLADTAIVRYNALTGSDKGAVVSNDTTLKDRTSSDASKFHNLMKQTTYTFVGETDSVYVDGLAYVCWSDEYPSVYLFTISYDHAFKYKFEDNRFMLLMDEQTSLNGQWVTVGYGTKEKFTVYIEYRAIYNDTPGGSSTESDRFIAPEETANFPDSPWVPFFFDETHAWLHYNTFTPEDFSSDYRAVWYIYKYDFAVSE